MSSIYCIIVVVTIFLRKHRKKAKVKLEEERETGRWLQSQDTNHVSTKTRTKTKYQTSSGKNLYSSAFSLSDLKLRLSIANGIISVGNETNRKRTFLYRPHRLH